MTPTPEQKLNAKLVKWVWPKARIQHTEFGDQFIPSGKPFRTHMIDAKPIPRYTRYLDDCLRDLMPKLLSASMNWTRGVQFLWIVELDVDTRAEGRAATSPLALCLAVEKLIDAEVIHD